VTAVHHPSSDAGVNTLAQMADGHGSVEADADPVSHGPDVAPPRVCSERTQHVAMLTVGGQPCLLGCHAQFAVYLLSVVMEPQRIQVGVGCLHLMNAMSEEVTGQTILPERRSRGYSRVPVITRLQSSTRSNRGRGSASGPNQRCGDTSNCHSAPTSAHCQRRTAAAGSLRRDG